MENNVSFQSSWTLAEALIWEIAAHLKNGRNYWLAGNLEKYYWEFETIIRAMYGLLDENEIKEAREKEEKILTYFPIKLDKIKELSGLLKEYDGIIMKFIHQHKLDIPPKRDRTKLVA